MAKKKAKKRAKKPTRAPKKKRKRAAKKAKPRIVIKKKKPKAVKSKKPRPKRKIAKTAKPRPKPKKRANAKAKRLVAKKKPQSVIFSQASVARLLSETVGRLEPKATTSGMGNEEIALRMLDVYFTEVARHGFKRTLSLDEIIDSYFYSLLRIERKGTEIGSIEQIIKKSK